MQSLSKRMLGAIGILYLLIMICINMMVIITSPNMDYPCKNYIANKNISFFIIALICVIGVVFFLPAMHERYGYLYEILGIILAILIPRTLPLCAGLIVISLNTYGAYLFNASVNWTFITCLNAIIFCLYIYCLNKELECAFIEEKTLPKKK